MFGLLTHRPQQSAHRAEFKKSYCGTCKAIGKMYGHKQRIMLNYDVVFLSEMLAEMSNRIDDFDAISVNKCFSLPKHETQIPPFLAYTASINILLAGIKILDNVEDSGYKANLWRALAWMQKKQFNKAKQYLEQSGLMMPLVDAHIAEQRNRERERRHLPNIFEAFGYYAEMTGSLTGEIFRQAANTVGKREASEDLFQIGKAFGEIVYLADAVNDYEQDLKSGTFNPLLTGTGKPSATLPPQASEIAQQYIAVNLLTIRHHLFKLPMAEQKKQSFIERLNASVYGAIYPSNACNTAVACHSKGMSIYERYQQAYNRAKLAFAPNNHNRVKIAGVAIVASLFAFVMLALPFKLLASTSTPAPQSQCWQDCINSCCESCCDSICNSICNP